MKLIKTIVKFLEVVFCNNGKSHFYAKDVSLVYGDIISKVFRNRCYTIFWSAIIANVIALLISYGSEDLMLKFYLISIGVAFLGGMLVYIAKSMWLDDDLDIPYPLSFVHCLVLITSIFAWQYGVSFEKLDHRCEKCNCLEHAYIYPRQDADCIDKIHTAKRYEKLVESENAENKHE